MKRFMILMLAMLMASIALGYEAQKNDGGNDAIDRFDSPNAKRLQELSDLMIEMKANDQFDQAIWDEFYGLLHGMDMVQERANHRANLDQGGDVFASAFVIPSLPFTDGGTTTGYANDYNGGWSYTGPDVVYKYTPSKDEHIQISLCGSYYDTRLIVYRNSTSDRIARNDDGCPQYREDLSLLSDVELTTGNTYYIVVDGYNNANGQYFLRVDVKGCDRLPDGLFQNGDGSFTYRQTTSESTTDTSLYQGPWYDPSDCGPDDEKGFGYYSAHDQDYDWRHYWPDWNTPGLNIQSVQVLICAYDVDEYSCNLDNPGHPEYCELDNIYADDAMQLPTYLAGDNGIDWVTVFTLSPSLLFDGFVNMFIDINVFGPRPEAGQCWCTTLMWSQLIVNYTIQQEENDPPYTPTGFGMPCVDDNTQMCVTITGPVPPDPNGDEVEYLYEWFVSNIGTGGGFQPDEYNPAHPVNHTGNCVPASDSDIGDIWKVHVFAKDIPHGAVSENYLEVTFPVIVFDCGEPPYTDVDMGDLDPCKYPTLIGNPSHGLSGIAWLGETVTSEAIPHPVNMDLDDGVEFIEAPWTPCYPEIVKVTVTGGQFYHAYADTGGKLYLNAWKDGNLDGDFCDYLCEQRVPEWIIRDKEVTADSTYTIDILDPGREDITHYAGIFRFRLTSRIVGPFGFGLIDRQACPDMTCGSFAHDFLGEVEDYNIPEFQLAVEMGSFDAIASESRITLRWNTLSESGNDRFVIARNGSVVAEVNSQGDNPSGHSYEWVDENVETGVSYSYTLSAVDIQGESRVLATTSATPTTTVATVTEYALYQNYPNPFNPTTHIAFDLVESGFVTLKIFNPIGQEVATVLNSVMEKGPVRHVRRHESSGRYVYLPHRGDRFHGRQEDAAD